MDKLKQLGALWLNRSAKGNDYFSGYLTLKGDKRINIVAFDNVKKNEKEPNIRIYLARPRAKQIPDESYLNPEEEQVNIDEVDW